MTVLLRLEQTSQPIIYTEVLSTYEKGSFYVIRTKEDKSIKFPINRIFSITETDN